MKAKGSVVGRGKKRGMYDIRMSQPHQSLTTGLLARFSISESTIGQDGVSVQQEGLLQVREPYVVFLVADR